LENNQGAKATIMKIKAMADKERIMVKVESTFQQCEKVT